MATKLHRRTLLRAAGIGLALPVLDVFIPSRVRAATEAVPRRLVCINTPLGLHPANFFPTTTGEEYKPSPYLEVLREFRGDFTVISGLSHPDVGPNHDSNLSFLTAAPHPERRAGFKNSISLDQFAAEHIYGQTRFPTLTLSCEGLGLSWTRSGAPVPTEDWPSNVFAKLFLQGRPEEVQAQERRLADGQSILDSLRQAKKLQGTPRHERSREARRVLHEHPGAGTAARTRGGVVEAAQAEGRRETARKHPELRRSHRQDASVVSTDPPRASNRLLTADHSAAPGN